MFFLKIALLFKIILYYTHKVGLERCINLTYLAKLCCITVSNLNTQLYLLRCSLENINFFNSFIECKNREYRIFTHCENV